MRPILASLFFLLAAGLLAEPLAPGIYKGKYEGSAGASGDFSVTLAKSGEAWTAAVQFSLAGENVTCKTTSVSVEGAKLKVVYTFELQGTPLESQIDGEFSSGKLGGKYRTQLVGDGTAVDEGTWSTSSGG